MHGILIRIRGTLLSKNVGEEKDEKDKDQEKNFDQFYVIHSRDLECLSVVFVKFYKWSWFVHFIKCPITGLFQKL